MYAVEYAALGAVAGALGSAGGTVLAWGILTRSMELAWRFPPVHVLAAIAASVLLSVGAGLGASLPALGMRPLSVLRAE